jgi:hypothetical protein
MRHVHHITSLSSTKAVGRLTSLIQKIIRATYRGLTLSLCESIRVYFTLLWGNDPRGLAQPNAVLLTRRGSWFKLEAISHYFYLVLSRLYLDCVLVAATFHPFATNTLKQTVQRTGRWLEYMCLVWFGCTRWLLRGRSTNRCILYPSCES